ncbi:ABC transporter substrate-binding protein [Acrocarpospora macrocephala]|uniref:Peptide ABC transporter n=1 Tax=Acrocarpospora macrocephala TaxID=150177 RepID=A0A5M3WNB4_9ACTN|nr:ABC transporter substrate-binding protein [Acrocarpospora macrocephala]GES08681.1 peptide ABC transporter [Acrocarpospora macrocephala]
MSLNRRLAIPVLTVLLALTACGTSATPAAQAPAGAPAKGGTLVFGVNTEPINLDPHASPQDVTGLFTRPVLDSLVALDDKGGIHPWLATSWEISADGKTYTFKLREGVKFSDGGVFDGAAVKANLDHIVDPKTKSQLAAAAFGPYEGTKVIDAQTVEVSFSKPYSPFLAALATAYFGIQSPTALAEGPEALAKKVVGTGPFVIDAFVPHQGITYHRNPDYNWAPEGAKHTGPAYLEKLEIKVLTEDAVRLGALTSGQIDAIASVPPVNVKQVEADPKLTIVRKQAPGGNYNYYPNTAKGVFADQKVRQAFRDGIDFATIVGKLYFGTFDPAFSPVSPATHGYDAATESQWRYDPEGAGRLLDEAGWTAKDAEGYRTKDGARLTVRWPFLKSFAREQRGTLAEQIQAEAKKIGFEVVFTDVTATDFAPKAIAGDYDLIDFSWQRADGDTLRNLFAISNIPSGTFFGQNLARYEDAEVDGWLSDSLATTDLAERAALYAKIQQKVNTDAVVFPVYVFNYLLGVSKNVRDIAWEPQAYPTFYDAWVSKA